MGNFPCNAIEQKPINGQKMKKRTLIVLPLLIFVVGLVLSLLFGIMPNEFKKAVADYAGTLGVPYPLFWTIGFLLIVLLMLLLVWKKAFNQRRLSERSNQQKHTHRQVQQHGDKSVYMESQNGDINIH